MLKKLLVGIMTVAMLVAFTPQVNAGPTHGPPGYYEKINGNSPQWDEGQLKYFPNGHPGKRSDWKLVQPYDPPCNGSCDDVVALAESGIMILSPNNVVDDKGMGWGTAGGEHLRLKAQALATGKDQKIWFFKIPGFALANVNLKLVAKVRALVLTTGEKLDTGGLSLTLVKSIGTLKFKGDAIAIGNDGCPQFAQVGLRGGFSVTAGGYALSTGPNGSGALTEATGTTVVRLQAGDSDLTSNGWFIFPPTAHASIQGFVIVKQGVFVAAYTSPDGMTTATFGIVKGGSALAFGDANITGIRASGQVNQESIAADGMGAIASGSSNAQFSGASGYVLDGRKADYANANGLAVVKGYNNITHTGNSTVITSSHSAFATTGNHGFVDSPQ